MASFPAVRSTQALTQNAEFSVAQGAAFNAASPRTTQGEATANIDLQSLVAGDIVEIRTYVGVNGGTLTVVDTVTVKTPQTWVIGPLMMDQAWDITVKLTTATGRTIRSTVLQNQNDVAVASGGIVAASFATDSITAAALAASAATEIQAGLATSTAVAGVQTDTTTLLGRLTSGRASNLDNLDAAVSTRAPATDTATLLARLTAIRAGLLDNLSNLDATISSRAPAATALSTAQWTNPRAALLDLLDVAVSTRASASALASLSSLVTSVGVAVSGVQSDTDDIQARLPATLDGGNIRASVQTLAGATITAIADAVMNYVVEAAPVNATTFVQRQRVEWAILAGLAHGLAISTTTAESFRDPADTKDRATFALGTDGTRTPGTFDGT